MASAQFRSAGEGHRLESGPGRDLVTKVSSTDSDGVLDFFVIDVGPLSGPPLHVHHTRDETIHVLDGTFKVRAGDAERVLEPGGVAFMPKGLPHAFLNLTGETARLACVFTPGGAAPFFEELGPLTRNGHPDRAAVAAVFERHEMTLLGPPLGV